MVFDSVYFIPVMIILLTFGGIILLCKEKRRQSTLRQRLRNQIHPEPPTDEPPTDEPPPDDRRNDSNRPESERVVTGLPEPYRGLVVYENSHIKGHGELTVVVDQEFVPHMDDINDIAKGLRFLVYNWPSSKFGSLFRYSLIQRSLMK